jgi:hypothetical protein
MTEAVERPAARATGLIEKPVDVVRAQFFDVEHHVRAKVHRGVSLKWIPPKPGDAKGVRHVRQETRVLTRVVVEEFVVEADGAQRWVKRFVEGPNRTGRYVATFTPDPSGHTRVELEAYAPAGGFDNGLGKLSQLGVEKALQALLQDHKRALDGYRPGGPHGDVERVLRDLKELTGPLLGRSRDEQRAVVSNFLEASAVVALADETADEAEKQTMRAAAKALCFVDLDAAAIDQLLASAREAVAKEGEEARCQKIGGRLKRLGFERLGVAFAALLAQVSQGLDVRELAVIQGIAHAAGVADSEVAEVVARIDSLLG